MTDVSFCTPISFGSGFQTHLSRSFLGSFLEFADDYFFFGGEKAVVQFEHLDGESLGVNLVLEDSSWISTALKVISYFTIILPVVLLIAKCILRSVYHFHLIPSLSNGLILRQHESVVVDEIVANTSLIKVLAIIVAGYITSDKNYDCFGAQKWMRYFDANVVDPEPALDPYLFYRFWYGPDPIDPTKQVYETHFPPVLRPRVITQGDTSYHYSLNTLGQLIQHPREGHPSRYFSDTTNALRQHGQTHAGPACWIVMRKEVVARNQLYLEQIQTIKDLNITNGIGYEEESFAIDLATVVSAHYVVTGERYLGDPIGVEKRWTYGLVKETYEDSRVVIGGFSSPLNAPGGLDVFGYNFSNISFGVVLLRKF